MGRVAHEYSRQFLLIVCVCVCSWGEGRVIIQWNSFLPIVCVGEETAAGMLIGIHSYRVCNWKDGCEYYNCFLSLVRSLLQLFSQNEVTITECDVPCFTVTCLHLRLYARLMCRHQVSAIMHT